VRAAGALRVLLVLFGIVDIPAPDLPALAEDSIDFDRKIGLLFGLVATAASPTAAGTRAWSARAARRRRLPPHRRRRR
jgi:hypothetical protein